MTFFENLLTNEEDLLTNLQVCTEKFNPLFEIQIQNHCQIFAWKSPQVIENNVNLSIAILPLSEAWDFIFKFYRQEFAEAGYDVKIVENEKEEKSLSFSKNGTTGLLEIEDETSEPGTNIMTLIVDTPSN